MSQLQTQPPPPFAPMPSAFVPPPGGVWREGFLVGMVRDADLPPFCYKCGEPAHGPPVKRSQDLLVGLFEIAVRLCAMFIGGKRPKVRISLCRRHRKKRRIRVGLAIASLVLGAMGWVLCGSGLFDVRIEALWLVGGSLIALFGPLSFLGFWSEASEEFVDERVVKLTGAANAFLARLPAFSPAELTPLGTSCWQPIYPPPAVASPLPGSVAHPAPQQSEEQPRSQLQIQQPLAFVPPAGGVWREDRIVGMLRDAEPPPFCFKCGAPAEGQPNERSVWCFGDASVGLVDVLWTIRSCSVRVCLCAHHRRHGRVKVALKRLALVLGFVALLLSVLVLGVTTGWLSTGILAAVAALLLGAACTFRSKDIFATFIDKQVVKLGGAGDAFLARLPAFLPAWAVVAGRPAAPALASPALPAAGAQAPGCYGK